MDEFDNYLDDDIQEAEKEEDDEDNDSLTESQPS
jgi:hypothetical protein